MLLSTCQTLKAAHFTSLFFFSWWVMVMLCRPGWCWAPNLLASKPWFWDYRSVPSFLLRTFEKIQKSILLRPTWTAECWFLFWDCFSVCKFSSKPHSYWVKRILVKMEMTKSAQISWYSQIEPDFWKQERPWKQKKKKHENKLLRGTHCFCSHMVIITEPDHYCHRDKQLLP